MGPLAARRVDPLHVLAAHTLLGLCAAALIRRGRRWEPALLLQVKTVLDNLDGQLARATGRTTETGRYLDTELDLLVNLAVNMAIHGRAGVATTLLQSLILTTDFVWEREYRLARGEVFRDSAAQRGDDPRVLAALRAVYAAYFTPQERVLEALSSARLRRVAGGPPGPADRRAYTPLWPLTLSANLGLTTQLAALGLCLAAGRPHWYARSLPVQALALLAAQLGREEQLRRARRELPPS